MFNNLTYQRNAGVVLTDFFSMVYNNDILQFRTVLRIQRLILNLMCHHLKYHMWFQQISNSIAFTCGFTIFVFANKAFFDERNFLNCDVPLCALSRAGCYSTGMFEIS